MHRYVGNDRYSNPSSPPLLLVWVSSPFFLIREPKLLGSRVSLVEFVRKHFNGFFRFPQSKRGNNKMEFGFQGCRNFPIWKANIFEVDEPAHKK
jgi:hypothetical protein